MVKNLILLALVAVIAVLGWYLLYKKDVSPAPVVETPTQQEEEMTICAQVITPAIHPDTREIVEFPTPCDVPDGWEIIENDIPSLDLEVQ